MWVYSGRRGIHCWICDDRARKLNANARKAIINYLEVVKGGSEMKRKVNLGHNVHPSIRTAFSVLEDEFIESIIVEQDILGPDKDLGKFLEILPSESARRKVSAEFDKKSTSLDRWKGACSVLDHTHRRDIMFQYLYPRLDANVRIACRIYTGINWSQSLVKKSLLYSSKDWACLRSGKCRRN
jgi:DNA primase small subunit